MQQLMVLDERLDRCPPGNHQAHQTGEHVALAGTCELVARASLGERGAWDQLVEHYGGLVWAVARAHGLGRNDASEVSQVTWLLLTQHLGALRQPERLGSWLLRTATREAYRMGRLRGHEGPTPASTSAPPTIFEARLGANHPDTARSRQNLEAAAAGPETHP